MTKPGAVPDIAPVVAAALAGRERIDRKRSVLVAISGIDASGKGFLATRVATALEDEGQRVAVLNVDAWLNLPSFRFSATNPAEHYYTNAIRFDAMFATLVLPLRDRRSLHGEFDYCAEPLTEYERHTFAYDDIDTILLEGIYLLKPAYRSHYDLSVWVECSFATALRRAIARGQEGLTPGATVEAYDTTFFAAQRIHFERDAPQRAATLIMNNDGSESAEGKA